MSFTEFLETKKLKRTVFILRGFPGSGKSYMAKKLLLQHGGDEAHIFSTDNYWIPVTRELRRKGDYVSPEDETQEYTSNWNADKLMAAHRNNLDDFKRAVDNGMTPLIVDNVNAKARDFSVYVKYADKAEYEIKIIEPESPVWKKYAYLLKDKKDKKKLDEFAHELYEINQKSHKVPLATIRKMIDKWQSKIDLKELLQSKD